MDGTFLIKLLDREVKQEGGVKSTEAEGAHQHQDVYIYREDGEEFLEFS